MSSVWLENVLTKQPARWLPPGYSDYGSLLTAAVENVVKQTRRRSCADLESMEVGKELSGGNRSSRARPASADWTLHRAGIASAERERVHGESRGPRILGLPNG